MPLKLRRLEPQILQMTQIRRLRRRKGWPTGVGTSALQEDDALSLARLFAEQAR